MENQTTDAILKTPTALAQIGTLAVHYGLSLAGAVVLLVGGWILSSFVSRWAYKGLSRIHGIDEMLARFFENVLHYGLLVLVFVMVLGQFGVQTASIVAALGAAGLAIGLALQGTLQNIAAGIMLLVLRPFRTGEYIETSSVKGKMVEVGLFATELRTANGLYLMAPNSNLWNTPILNHSREPDRLQELSIAIGNDVDVGSVKKIILDIVSADHRVKQNPSPRVLSDDLTADKTTLKIEYWTSTSEWTDTRYDLIDSLKDGFAEKGIPIK
ncbi:mechanosensitive ion channel family protein [Rhizobium leguminosarum]|uniref:mechanosensitive ion channel family protein n=1 Tax=Rhizobium leguminosarum TaxID=384 RepID=UPI001C9078F2|nr:mechanosensitive ion channel domain-containing protein [Rhizobium leguminosarum]MBY3001992.1 mechanosensitive ion channel [Rhizobium leguminosarum]